MHIALINMPMAIIHGPSIQLGILRSLLNQMGVSSTTLNLNMELARRMGSRLYTCFTNYDQGENPELWFASKTWGSDIPEFSEPSYNKYKPLAEQFIDDMLELRWSDYNVFAFSCTFNTMPALCLGKHLKKLFPQTKLIYGGSQFFEDAALELMKHLPWIDYIFVGEAEYSFPKVIKSFERETRVPNDMLGVVFRSGGKIVYNGVDKVDINDSPPPDYSEYFAQLPNNRDLLHREVSAAYEASRGCWYGEKKHCKFCSLNHEMSFRSKKAETVLRELCEMYDSYEGIEKMPLTDNILDRSYLRTLIPALRDDERCFNMFVEIKPDLSPYDLKVLKEAGFNTVQAGVESFHSGFTRLMDKGQSVLNCISFLKWCKYFRINVQYNLLYRIPFEEEQWYDEQLETIKKIVHFSIPRNCSPIVIQRYGVYYQSKLLNDLVPDYYYRFLYPDYMDLDNIAYRFDYDQSVVVDEERNMATLAFVNFHKTLQKQRYLRFLTDRLVMDTRDGSERSYKLSKSQFDLLKFCIGPKTQRETLIKFRPEDIEYLTINDLLIALEGKILSLVEVEDGDLETLKPTSLNVLKKV